MYTGTINGNIITVDLTALGSNTLSSGSIKVSEMATLQIIVNPTDPDDNFSDNTPAETFEFDNLAGSTLAVLQGLANNDANVPGGSNTDDFATLQLVVTDEAGNTATYQLNLKVR